MLIDFSPSCMAGDWSKRVIIFKLEDQHHRALRYLPAACELVRRVKDHPLVREAKLGSAENGFGLTLDLDLPEGWSKRQLDELDENVRQNILAVAA